MEKHDNVADGKKKMNKFVMNFLVTECYLEAAKKFQLDSGTEPQIAIATITHRVAVKKAVLDGNMEDAIQKVNDWYPEILVANPQLYFHLQQQQFIELIRNGNVEDALEFVHVELAPKAENDQGLSEELERTVALLTFEDVTNCPVSQLLHMSQRNKTASEVNAAILAIQIHEKDPRLAGLLQELILLQKEYTPRWTHGRANDIVTLAFVLTGYMEQWGDLMSLF